MTDDKPDLTCPIRLVDTLPTLKVGNAVRCPCGTYTKVLLRPYVGQPRHTIEEHDKPAS